MIQNNKKEILRLNAYLSKNNIASRREGDEMIKKGLVFINGVRAKLGDKVNPTDKVLVKKGANLKNYVYYAYNKPKGIVTTNKSKGERDIISTTKFPEKVYPVGRLDKDSHGLILLTNDGRIVKKILDPSYAHEKEYLVQVNKQITPTFLEQMKNGVVIDGYKTKHCKVNQESQNSFSIVLTEGKNRQIRRMCEALKYAVTDLQRTRIMNISLGKLKPGEWKEVKLKSHII